MLEPSTIVSDYRIDALLGRGGMGVVYRATQLSLKRTVALKVLAPHLAADRAFAARFRREGETLARLAHPHIVTAFSAGDSEHGPYLAMEYVDGSSLEVEIARGALTPARAVGILAQAAEALDWAHAKGLDHRDVKPANILVDQDGFAYLADFGLTRGGEHTSLTGTGLVVGTRNYLSPEQLQGQESSPASDIYAFAVTLYECLTGEVPFAGVHPQAVAYAHVNRPPPRVSDARPDLPQAIDRVVAAGMAKHPAARPSSASALVAAAAAALDLGGVAATELDISLVAEEPLRSPSGALQRADPMPPRRTPRRRAALLVAATAIAGAAVGLITTSGDGTATAPPPATAAVSRVDGATFAHAGPARLPMPDGWRTDARAPARLGFGRDDTVAITSPGATGTTAVVTTTNVVGDGLLPDGVLRRLAGTPRHPARVTVGRYPAYRYAGLRLDSLAGRLAVYVIPTTTGVVALGCWVATVGKPDTCPQLLAGVVLPPHMATSLAPEPALASRLRTTLRSFSAARRRSRTALSRARRTEETAHQAEALAQAHARAAHDIAEGSVEFASQRARAQLVAALRAARDSYTLLARAASWHQRVLYGSRVRATRRGDERLGRALAGLRALGYSARIAAARPLPRALPRTATTESSAASSTDGATPSASLTGADAPSGAGTSPNTGSTPAPRTTTPTTTSTSKQKATSEPKSSTETTDLGGGVR
jgi:hypothetical protein